MAHRQFARAMRRKTQWGGFGDEAGTAALGSMLGLTAGTPVILSANVVISSGVGILDEEVTIIRTLGNITARMNSVTAAAQGRCAIGCIVIRNEALVAGVASLPSPEDDPDAEWLFYTQFDVVNPQTSALQGSNSPSDFRTAFDVRGQRIMRSGHTVVWLAETETESLLVGVAGRYLCKLT